ncbi:GTPase Era [Taibaiella chishuiensis]|uniref:GTPase Era n=1 Tax=Taibaiella chishuiensis TaxID=1434707 RepID=A0A2P8DD40_9BACT|nr:GTPase Era [Taibaiella chishuiensis]PSK95140.1 GTP-binding protein Era [Taibaiella chishuiensis]
MERTHKAGFVNIFGPPNAGKSTLMNALLGETLAIVSPKVQTTRHRILGIVTEEEYQIIFSDTPGIIDPQYKLHTKMMMQVRSAVEDADVALLMVDVTDNPEEFAAIIEPLKLKTKKILLINKVDLVADKEKQAELVQRFEALIKPDKTMTISALKKMNTKKIIPAILKFLPEAPAFYPDEDISDRPMRFFVSEMIREQIYAIYDQEIPYHTAVLIQAFEEKPHVTRILADIIVTRETQKMILLGAGGSMIKKLGIQSRQSIEKFLDKKVHLELFVKVRPKWRENDTYLKEYGY